MSWNYLYINILILMFINLLVFNNIRKFQLLFNINDNSNSKRKIHTGTIPKIGGLLVFLVIFLFYLLLFSFQKINLSLSFGFAIPLFLVFVLGVLDDKFDFNATLKLFILLIVFYIFLILNPDFIIKELSFNSFKYKILLESFSIPFSILCFLLLINSINMIDGTNGLCAAVQFSIFLSIFLLTSSEKISLNDYFIIHKDILSFNIIYLTTLFFFIIRNFQNKIFLGDAGAYLGSIVIIINIVYFYKNSPNLKCDQIFLLLSMPGIDMFRVFLFRVLNKKNPFKADNIHLHHLLLKKFNNIFVLLIIVSMIIIPNFISIFFKHYTLEAFILFMLSYIFLLVRHYKQNV